MTKEVSAQEDSKPPSQSNWLGEHYTIPKLHTQPAEIDLKKIIPLRKVSPMGRVRTNQRTALFRKKFFPNISSEEWNDSRT